MRAAVPLILASLPALATAQATEERSRTLEQKVELLEQRVASLERELHHVARLAGETPEAARWKARAAARIAEEREKFGAGEVAEVEAMYVRASRDLSSLGSKAVLDSIVSRYPHLNRAGCAQLYRAQQESGTERERLLKDCIERFSASLYGDGAQVGPLALYQLAIHYEQTGRQAEAARLFTRIRKKHPLAIDHRGLLLVHSVSGKSSSVANP